jgi:hypothetical protein
MRFINSCSLYGKTEKNLNSNIAKQKKITAIMAVQGFVVRPNQAVYVIAGFNPRSLYYYAT